MPQALSFAKPEARTVTTPEKTTVTTPKDLAITTPDASTIARPDTPASNLRRPVSGANVEQLSAFSTVEVGVRCASDDATLTCRCGKLFTENQRREFVMHKRQCREGTPPAPPSAGRHYQGATLPVSVVSTAKTTGKHNELCLPKS